MRALVLLLLALAGGCAPWRVSGDVATLKDPAARRAIVKLGVAGDLETVTKAVVTCEGCANAGAIADAEGHFTIDLGSPLTPKTLHVRAEGFEPLDFQIPAAERASYTQPPSFGFVLKRLNTPSEPVRPAPSASPCAGAIARARTRRAIVRVEALEHVSLGALVGAPDRVVVPFATVEVDRPGVSPRVYDALGGMHAARIVATDRKAGLALLALGTPIDAEPFEPGSTKSACFVALVPGEERTWVEHADFPDETRIWHAPTGSPILDETGRVAGMMLANDDVAEVHGLFDAGPATAHGRPFIFYGALAPLGFEFAPRGALWIGMQGGAGVVYRDVLSARLDVGFYLLPAPDSRCGEPPCADGGRIAISPSIGPKIRLGGIGGSEAWSIYVTPSIGYAMALQDVTHGPAFDRDAKAVLWRLAPGVAFQAGPVELATRWRIAPADLGGTTYAITAGMVF
jgi:hypothetical protein